jgi:hypothetical protein
VDEPPGPGAWRRLWPESTGVVRQAARLRTGLVAGHPWKMREWLTPPVSTGAASLAYLDSESAPFVVGRARGAGRIVLVTALDAWRWRAEPDAAFAAGWRALVQRLAADVPAPLTATVWSTGSGRQRWLHVDAIVRPDVAARRGLTVVGNVEGESPVAVPLVRVDSGRWRGASRVDTTRTRLVAEARAGSLAVGRASAVVDASPLSPAVSWEDVHRHQTERGALATDPAGLSDSLARVRSARTSAEGKRWYATQTWWFAGLALSLLGTEWILRRLHGER